jgi:predicted ester cyclase
MGSGEEYHTPQGVLEMLNYFYNVAFDAVPETRNMIFADGQVVFEGVFAGKHIGEFAGIPATHKDVRVPLTVIYDLEDNQIKQGRIYFLMASLMAQLGV